MKALIFGNKGQVGREIEELAAIKKIQTVGFDIDSVDITSAEQVAQVFANNHDVDVVINAAAYTAVDKAEDEPAKAFAVNADAVKNLSVECKKYRIPLLHISTDYVFSGDKKGSYVEDDLTSPLGVYGKSKLSGEEVLRSTWEQYIILRISWVFGKHGQNFVKTMLRLAKERDELNVVNDQFGCPTAAADVARVLLELAEKIASGTRHWGIYNYCNSPATNWHQFATRIIELGREKFLLQVKKINAITTEQFPTKTKRPHNSELLVEKIWKDYGITRHGWEEYLQRVIAEI